MKKTQKLLSVFLALVMILSALPLVGLSGMTVAFAEGEPVCNPEDYLYYVENDKVTITGYAGNDVAIEIPSVIDGYYVTDIFGDSFSNNTNLISVVIGDNITSIDYSAFEACTNLKSVILGEKLTYIGTTAFAYCSSLSNLVFNDNLTDISHCAFEGCNSLTKIVIPDSVKFLGDGVFRDCSSLTELTIGSGVSKILPNGFVTGCDNLSSIVVDADNQVYDSRNNCNAIIETSTNSLICGCNSTVIPGTVTSIGDNSFFICKRLKEILIPDGVTVIGDSAFNGCDGVTTITISKSVKSIGWGAFSGIDFEIPIYYTGTEEEWNNIITADPYELYIRNIEYNYIICNHEHTEEKQAEAPTCFSVGFTEGIICNDCGRWIGGHEEIAKISHIDEDFDVICDVCGKSLSDILPGCTQTIDIISEEIKYLRFIPTVSGKYKFESLSEYDTFGYLFDENKEEIISNDDGEENSNFAICYELEKGKVYYYAARYYDSSRRGSFDVKLTLIEQYCAHIDDDLNNICDICNRKISDIVAGETKTIEIPDGDSYFCKYVPLVSGTYNFRSVSSEGTNGYLCDNNKNEIASDKNYYSDNFSITHFLEKGKEYYWRIDAYEDTSLNIQLTLMEEYCDHTDDNKDNLCDKCCKKLNLIAEGFISNNIKWNIDDTGLLYLSGTGSIYFPEDAPWVDNENDIISIEIENGVSGIKAYTFANLTKLESVVLPDSISEIDEGAFFRCSNLKQLTIPDGVKYIDQSMFEDCENLSSVFIPKSVKKIWNDAFYGCKSLKKVQYAGSYEEWDNIDVDEGNEILNKVEIEYDYISCDHIYQEHKAQYQPTCTECGYAEGVFCKDCQKWISGHTIIPALGHHLVKDSAVAATCTKAGKTEGEHCTRCDYRKAKTTIAKLGHSYKATVTLKATTSKSGKLQDKCSRCGYTKSTFTTIPMIKSATLSYTTATYNGKAKSPTVTVKDSNGNKLVKGTDYTVSYSNNKNIGKATAKITFKGNYSGTKSLTYKIVPGKVMGLKATQTTTTVKLTWTAVSGAKTYRIYKYSSTTKKYTQIGTTSGTNYTIKNLKAGTIYTRYVKASKTVNDVKYMSTSYAKIKTATKPSAPKTPTLTAGTKKITAKWMKSTGATGCELYMKKGNSGTYNRIYYGSKTSFTKSSLTKGSTYYFKVRAYKTVDGKKIYSAYSSSKYIKAK